MDKTNTKFSTRFVSILLAVLTLVSVLPISLLTAAADDATDDTNDFLGDPLIEVPNSDTPSDYYPIMPMANPGTATPSAEMLNNEFLDALAGTGYKLDAQRDNDTLFVNGYYASRTPTDILSGIPYAAVSRLDMTRTRNAVMGEKTATGQVPDIDYIKSRGMECGGYVSYVFMNYLPNVKGITYEGLNDYPDYLPTHSPATWWEKLDDMVSKGKAELIQIGIPDESLLGMDSNSSADITYIDWSTVEIGDIIIFGNSKTLSWSSIKHIGIYAGTCYNGSRNAHFMTHVGNARGPEITEVRYMAMGDSSKTSIPVAIYRLKTTNNPGNIQITKKSTNGGTVAGWQFTIYSDSDCKSEVETLTTDSDGIATSKELNPGTFYVKETGYPYDMTEEQKAYWGPLPTTILTVEVKAGETTSTGVTFTNNWYGKIEIVKTTNTGGTKAGWQFTIYSDRDCSEVVGTYISGTDGTITTGQLDAGVYYVKESGYPTTMTEDEKTFWNALPTTAQKVEVEAGETATVTFKNNQYSKITIVKDTPDGGTKVGWQFTIYSDRDCSEVVGTYTSGSDGTITTGLLDEGTYWIKESDYPTTMTADEKTYWAPLPTTAQSVTVDAGEIGTVTFSNNRYGKISIVKTTTNNGTLEGWQFNIYSDSACTNPINSTTYVSDANGNITMDQLVADTYYVKEVDYPASMTEEEKSYWILDTSIKTVTVEAGKTATASFTNNRYGRAEIVKTATNGGTVEGWQFTLYMAPDATGTSAMVGIYTTGSDSRIATELLEPGIYYVKETGYPDTELDKGYYWSDLPTDAVEVTVRAGETASVSFENKWYGRIEISKTLKNPEAGSLDGWTFEVRDSDGNFIGTYVTDKDGRIMTDKIEPGTYTVTEILDENSVWFCASPNPQTVTVTAGETASVTFDNALRSGKISVEKTDDYGMPLEGAEFMLEWSDDGVTWQPVSFTNSEFVKIGSCMSEGIIDGALTTGADGVVVFEGLYPLHFYRLTETVAPDGYQLLTSPVFEGQLDVEEDLELAFRVVNHPLPTLPVTGGNMLMLLPLGMIVPAVLGFVLICREDRKTVHGVSK